MGLWCSQMDAGGWLLMIALWVSVVALVVWAVGRLFPSPGTPDARALLDTRLASGEIDSDTYHSLRYTLDHTTHMSSRRAQP